MGSVSGSRLFDSLHDPEFSRQNHALLLLIILMQPVFMSIGFLFYIDSMHPFVNVRSKASTSSISTSSSISGYKRKYSPDQRKESLTSEITITGLESSEITGSTFSPPEKITGELTSARATRSRLESSEITRTPLPPESSTEEKKPDKVTTKKLKPTNATRSELQPSELSSKKVPQPDTFTNVSKPIEITTDKPSNATRRELEQSELTSIKVPQPETYTNGSKPTENPTEKPYPAKVTTIKPKPKFTTKKKTTKKITTKKPSKKTTKRKPLKKTTKRKPAKKITTKKPSKKTTKRKPPQKTTKKKPPKKTTKKKTPKKTTKKKLKGRLKPTHTDVDVSNGITIFTSLPTLWNVTTILIQKTKFSLQPTPVVLISSESKTGKKKSGKLTTKKSKLPKPTKWKPSEITGSTFSPPDKIAHELTSTKATSRLESSEITGTTYSPPENITDEFSSSETFISRLEPSEITGSTFSPPEKATGEFTYATATRSRMESSEITGTPFQPESSTEEKKPDNVTTKKLKPTNSTRSELQPSELSIKKVPQPETFTNRSKPTESRTEKPHLAKVITLKPKPKVTTKKKTPKKSTKRKPPKKTTKKTLKERFKSTHADVDVSNGFTVFSSLPTFWNITTILIPKTQISLQPTGTLPYITKTPLLTVSTINSFPESSPFLQTTLITLMIPNHFSTPSSSLSTDMFLDTNVIDTEQFTVITWSTLRYPFTEFSPVSEKSEVSINYSLLQPTKNMKISSQILSPETSALYSLSTVSTGKPAVSIITPSNFSHLSPTIQTVIQIVKYTATESTSLLTMTTKSHVVTEYSPEEITSFSTLYEVSLKLSNHIETIISEIQTKQSIGKITPLSEKLVITLEEKTAERILIEPQESQTLTIQMPLLPIGILEESTENVNETPSKQFLKSSAFGEYIMRKEETTQSIYLSQSAIGSMPASETTQSETIERSPIGNKTTTLLETISTPIKTTTEITSKLTSEIIETEITENSEEHSEEEISTNGERKSFPEETYYEIISEETMKFITSSDKMESSIYLTTGMTEKLTEVISFTPYSLPKLEITSISSFSLTTVPKTTTLSMTLTTPLAIITTMISDSIPMISIAFQTPTTESSVPIETEVFIHITIETSLPPTKTSALIEASKRKEETTQSIYSSQSAIASMQASENAKSEKYEKLSEGINTSIKATTEIVSKLTLEVTEETITEVSEELSENEDMRMNGEITSFPEETDYEIISEKIKTISKKKLNSTFSTRAAIISPETTIPSSILQTTSRENSLLSFEIISSSISPMTTVKKASPITSIVVSQLHHSPTTVTSITAIITKPKSENIPDVISSEKTTVQNLQMSSVPTSVTLFIEETLTGMELSSPESISVSLLQSSGASHIFIIPTFPSPEVSKKSATLSFPTPIVFSTIFVKSTYLTELPQTPVLVTTETKENITLITRKTSMADTAISQTIPSIITKEKYTTREENATEELVMESEEHTIFINPSQDTMSDLLLYTDRDDLITDKEQDYHITDDEEMIKKLQIKENTDENEIGENEIDEFVETVAESVKDEKSAVPHVSTAMMIRFSHFDDKLLISWDMKSDEPKISTQEPKKRVFSSEASEATTPLNIVGVTAILEGAAE